MRKDEDMGKLLSKEEIALLFQKLKRTYDLYGPKRFVGDGCFSDTDTIRYGLLENWEDLVWDQKSDYSFKEILFPISETILYFTEDEMKVPDEKERRNLVFLRSCDMHALKRLDEIYLRNGAEDFYYKRMRENTDFILMGCDQSFTSCFCVSMGSNHYDNTLAIFPQGEGAYLKIDAEGWSELLKNLGQEADQEIPYVKENQQKVEIPKKLPDGIQNDPLWEEYTSRCIGCGRCNFVCPTCTCFTMQDIFYKDNPKTGERRRVWASCQVDGYTDMAGGIQFRKTQGDRMRFKVLHKINDFNKRFGYQMCIGCGRCEDVCPEYISYIECVRKLKEKEDEANV